MKTVNTGTGWERSKRTHFDEIVVNYDRIRPKYPEELFADIFDYAGAVKGKKALEIGAGTGKATLPVLAAGYSVTAVEIGENMAEFLRKKFAGNNAFNVIVAPFEDAFLEESSYDLIYAASAFHWVDAEVGCPKAFRLLKNGGVVALFRFNWIKADEKKLHDKLEAVYKKHYFNYYISKPLFPKDLREEYSQPTGILRGYGFKDLKEYGFTDVEMKLYDVEIVYSADEYIEMLDTMSDHRNLPDDNRLSLYEGIKNAILTHGGSHKVGYVFQLYMGKKK